MTDTETTPAADQVVKEPTFLQHIQYFFRPSDVDCMRSEMNLDLSQYKQVRDAATDILSQTGPPKYRMPRDPEGRWSAERHQTFKNWIDTGRRLGDPPPVPVEAATSVAPTRLRKDVTTLSDAEFELLGKAFAGLMERDHDPADTTSYFALAGLHGVPNNYCAHHQERYNPWHRYCLHLFEDALRSVEGCEQVTLPYWDIATDLPDRLQHPPFDKYTLPRKPNGIPVFPYTTTRFEVADIRQRVEKNVLPAIEISLKEAMWGEYGVDGYQQWSIQAHDNGHDSIGPTMEIQKIAAFDPVFWFFHCNLDRLWSSWQTRVGASTLRGFYSTLRGSTDWLDKAPYNELRGLGEGATADKTIETDASYDRLELESTRGEAMQNLAGSLEAERGFTISSSNPVSVRVKGIDRLNIPGTFVLTLLADGEPIAQQAFFQRSDPRNCETCVQVGLVNLDFRLPWDQVVDRRLSIRINVRDLDGGLGEPFPLPEAGDPTINVRLLGSDA